MSLSELIAPAPRVAFVGLAKNTGKTETLTCALRELEQTERRVGVTSVGRDGEARDVIDIRIEKPRIALPAGSLVTTTDALLRASAIAHERLAQTQIRTPLGSVVVARLRAAGTIEIAGPSAAHDVRAVSDTMLDHGAAQVFIDGAIDRRAASSPSVSDGLVMSTGAILHEEIEQVVSQTRDAVDLVRLAEHSDPHMRALAASQTASMLIGEPPGEPLALPPHFALSANRQDIAALLNANRSARHLVLQGALCEPFLEDLLQALRGRELQLTVGDSTKVFLSRRSCAWYAQQGITIRVLAPIRLLALTLNPTAPQSHSFNSARLRALLQDAIPAVPIIDVRARGALCARAWRVAHDG